MPLYRQTFLADNLPAAARLGSRLGCYWMVRNDTDFPWEPDDTHQRYVVLAVSADGEYLSTALPLCGPVWPGEVACFCCTIALPERLCHLQLTAELVHHNHAFFTSGGADQWRREISLVQNRSAAEDAEVAGALTANYSYFLPAGGVVTRRDGGRWPVFARRAFGARVETTDGGEYIDYLMGWGSALLGHGHERIADAVEQELRHGVTVSLPHYGEVETGRDLLALFPNHQMVQFGKNGSDVCTLAVRMMRVHTGRKKILFWGYHGWQDWFTARLGFEQSGVADTEDLHAIVYGDADGLDAYAAQHAKEIAGIIMEPGAAVIGPEGPIPELDATYLRSLRRICDRHGFLLAFDEIYTGFRHPGGSAQAAAGVEPDITLLGKGLAAGYPLGAMLTSRALFESTAGRVMYGPTYKGERLSLAACRAALAVYRELDVPALVGDFGLALRREITSFDEAAELGLEFIGPPYRQMAVFRNGGPLLRKLRRTLLLQELLRRGVLSYKGLFLPSAAHGERELEQTITRFREALIAVLAAGNGPEIVRRLEIVPAY